MVFLFGCASNATRLPASSLQYVVVGVSGFGTGPDGKGQPSGAHDNLPLQRGAIASVHRLTHSGSRTEYQEILAPFQCVSGQQASGDHRLIIMANSWGAGRGVDLARRYQRECGRQVELFIMVDGIQRHTTFSFGTKPPAVRCLNYYQRLSTVRGRAIEGCENEDMSNECQRGGLGDCHIQIEWDGTALGEGHILETVRGEVGQAQ